MKINEKMDELLKLFHYEAIITRSLLDRHSHRIHELSLMCESHGYFNDHVDLYPQWIQAIEEDEQIADPVLHAWARLMARVNEAPSPFHREGAIILHLPLVDFFLQGGESLPCIILAPVAQHPVQQGQQCLHEMLMSRRKWWPHDATCATQEPTGHIIYWNMPVEQVEEQRKLAGKRGLYEQFDFYAQVDSWWQNMEYPTLACDWEEAVVTPNGLMHAYLDMLQQNKVPFDQGVKLATEWVQELGGDLCPLPAEESDGSSALLALNGVTAHCFRPYQDSTAFYCEC